MIIYKKNEMRYELKKIGEDNNHSLRIDSKGNLVINGVGKTNLYLAYVNGQWYGGKGINAPLPKSMMRSLEENACDFADRGKHLFVISEKRFWMLRGDGTAECAAPLKPLSEETIAFVFAQLDSNVNLYVIDGSKYHAVMSAKLDLSIYALNMAAMIVIALVRQHDPDSARQMEEYWISKETERQFLRGIADQFCHRIVSDEEESEAEDIFQ